MSTASKQIGQIRNHPKRSAFYLVSIVAILIFISILHEAYLQVGLAFTDGYELPTHRIHAMMIGALFLSYTLGLVSQLYRPEERFGGYLFAAILASIFVVLGLVLAGISSLEETLLFFIAIVLIGLLHPAGSTLLGGYSLSNSWFVILAALGAITFIVIGLLEVHLHLTAADSHTDMGHYIAMSTGAFTISFCAALAALRPDVWRPLAWGAAFLAILPFGFGMLAFPGAEQGSGLPTVLSVAIIIWAVAFVALGEYFDRTAV